MPVQDYFSWRFHFKIAWLRSRTLLRLFHTRDDLARLQGWAKRKRLKYPLLLYQRRSAEVEHQISFLTMRDPHSFWMASMLYALNLLISRSPAYFAKGAAAHYKRG